MHDVDLLGTGRTEKQNILCFLIFVLHSWISYSTMWEDTPNFEFALCYWELLSYRKKVFIFHIHLSNCCNISYWLYIVEMSKSEKYTSLLLYQECPLESYWTKLVSSATPLFRSAQKCARLCGSHYAATQSESYSACLKKWIIQFQDKDGFFSLTMSSDNSLQIIACGLFTSDI